MADAARLRRRSSARSAAAAATTGRRRCTTASGRSPTLPSSGPTSSTPTRSRRRALRLRSTSRDGETPFLMYVAYTAPHWPLHARAEDVAAYDGAFADGWDELRERRLERLHASGLVQPGTGLVRARPAQPAWSDVEDPAWQQRRMEVYAAQVEVMDRGDRPDPRPPRGERARRRHDRGVPGRQRGVRRGAAARRPRGGFLGTALDRPAVDPRRRPAARSATAADVVPGPGGHLRQLRAGLGEPLQHAVPPLQALGARGRDRVAVRGALAGRRPGRRSRSCTRPSS